MTPPPIPPGPERPLLYAFQHVALREAAFENHPELLRELAEGPFALPLLHFRSRARLRCAQAGWPVADDLDDEAMHAQDHLFDLVTIRPHQRMGHTVHLVTMPPPEFSPEAHFAAIVYRDGEAHEYGEPSPSTRYVTLEMTGPGERPAVCEWLRDGSHRFHGTGPEPQAEAFVEAVFQLVAARRP